MDSSHGGETTIRKPDFIYVTKLNVKYYLYREEHIHANIPKYFFLEDESLES